MENGKCSTATRIGIAPTISCIAPYMKIPRAPTWLAQGRINAPIIGYRRDRTRCINV